MLDSRDISAADQQQLGLALAGRGSVNAPLPFAAGLAGEETYGAFAWRDLPGMHTQGEFKAHSWFRDLGAEPEEFATATYGSGYGGAWCFAEGSTGYNAAGSVVLGATVTGAHQSLLGSIFTTGESIVIASGTEPLKTFEPPGLGGITRPCEINGFVFFLACAPTGTEVVGYLPPPLWVPDGTFGSTEALQRRVQHFSSEGLGTAGRVGLWQGRIVLATSTGIWGIKALEDGQGYGIDAQIESWNLSGEVQFAITHDDIWALDQGVLLRRGQSAEMIGSCGFTVLNGDGRLAVLSEPGGRFAVSNGSDFEEFGGDQRASVVGTLLASGGRLFSTERAAWSASSVWLTTTWANFPNSIALESVHVDPSVLRVKVITETGAWDLAKSAISPSLWRAGYGGTRIKLMFEVPVGVAITAPVLKLKRRTMA